LILTLQYLRGVAALLVVIFHLETQTRRLGYLGYWPEWMFVGVDVFFILSGFLMWAITANRSQSPKDFLLRRFVRVAPLYWLITSVVVGVMLFAPNLMMTGRFVLSHVIGSYLFVAMPNSSGWLTPVLNVGWTLNLEILFYVIFACCLLIPKKFRIAAVSATMSLIVASGQLFPENNIWALQYTSSILYEFVFGMCIAQLYQNGRLAFIGPLLASLMIASGFFLFIYNDEISNARWRAVTAGLPAAVVFIGFLALEEKARLRPMRWLEALGNSSYSLYLTHLITLSVVFQIWRKLGGESFPAGVWIFSLLALFSCLLVAEIVFRFLEKPINGLFQELLTQINWIKKQSPVG